jgi:putative hemolysin
MENESEPVKKFIDVEAVIRSKNPALLNWIPKIALRYIKRILHQDHVNDFIRRHGEKTSFAFVDEIIREFGAVVSSEGLEHLPASGGCIIAANHPIGGLDAMALIQSVASKRSDQQFIVNDVLMNITNLKDLFIGVNKHGKNPTEALQRMDEAYAGSGAVLIFPAGLVSRKQKSGIKDLVWKKSFITKARKFQRDIIPVHISGRNSDFFYNLAKWRNRLGIQANIEMFYLMDEMYHQFGKNIHIRFGEPISYSTFTTDKKDQEWAEAVKNHVYKLAEGPALFQPYSP